MQQLTRALRRDDRCFEYCWAAEFNPDDRHLTGPARPAHVHMAVHGWVPDEVHLSDRAQRAGFGGRVHVLKATQVKQTKRGWAYPVKGLLAHPDFRAEFLALNGGHALHTSRSSKGQGGFWRDQDGIPIQGGIRAVTSSLSARRDTYSEMFDRDIPSRGGQLNRLSRAEVDALPRVA